MQRVAIAPSQIHSTELHLNDKQIHYLQRVLRLQVGDRFVAMDGLGHWWVAQLETVSDRATLLESLPVANELPIPITLLVAMPKGSGMDDIVRQCTELGVHTIVPVVSDRTLLQPSPQKLDRWRRIACEAAEQSERQIIPAIDKPLAWAEALSLGNPEQDARYLCAARGNSPLLLNALTQQLADSPKPTSIVLATGPEGGFTAGEEELAIAHQFQLISLGRRILRAVTAPGCAIAVAASVLESTMGSKQGFSV
ncbi:16S rRNA (uracil(1498)-N(3))-methyltransferase [Leptolyngbya sp. FACHB-16]|nr:MULTISPECIES: 16S rRNA (uracil(1498)-N(3))-methyltransferase [unclassified Leptolyngbya]MBD1911812.1 16S rRNA (uracil(1498)-N(3))-methyltransferase [Leptolyngbya sp. FACHB-8]MBD2153298.1 16S rRNA (uracil(1498)-N(3))-methyltransferase [Leptolyngbya sp. FACHB-16]